MKCPACEQEREAGSQYCPWCFSTTPAEDAEPLVAMVHTREAPAAWLPPPAPTGPPPWATPPAATEPMPGMSVPADLFDRSKPTRRIPLRWLATALPIAAVIAVNMFGGSLWDLVVHQGWRHEKATAAKVLLDAADFDGTWVEEPLEDADDVTVGLTPDEADCMDVDTLQPVAEKPSNLFVKDTVSVDAQVGVWKNASTARKAAEIMRRPGYVTCAFQQLQTDMRKDDPSGALRATLLGSGPLASDATINRLAFEIAGPDGAFTIELFQAFEGRTQVTLAAYTPSGVDQALAADLVGKMVARAR